MSDGLGARLFLGLDGAARRRGRRATSERQRRGWFRRLRENLCRTSRGRSRSRSRRSPSTRPDAGVWERLEEALLLADCGVPATVEIIERLEAEAAAGRLAASEELTRGAARAIVADMLRRERRARIDVTRAARR